MSSAEFFQPIHEIKASEEEAHRETREFLETESFNEVLQHADGFHRACKDLLDEDFRRSGELSEVHLQQALARAYPEAPLAERNNLAAQMASLVQERFGEPSEIPQSEIQAAKARREAAVEELAERMSPEEVTMLEQQARERFAEKEFPEDFEAVKSHWLAELVAEGKLYLPVHRDGDE